MRGAAVVMPAAPPIFFGSACASCSDRCSPPHAAATEPGNLRPVSDPGRRRASSGDFSLALSVRFVRLGCLCADGIRRFRLRHCLSRAARADERRRLRRFEINWICGGHTRQRSAGIEDNALRPLPLGVNANDRRRRGSRLAGGQFGQARVCNEEQREQHTPDPKKITRHGHLHAPILSRIAATPSDYVVGVSKGCC